MHTHSKDNIKQELFDRHIQQTIGDYPFEVDESCWTCIDKRLNQRRVKMLVLRVLGSTVAVAAFFLFVFSLTKVVKDSLPLPVDTLAQQDIIKEQQVIESLSGGKTPAMRPSETVCLVPVVTSCRKAADVLPDASASSEGREVEAGGENTPADFQADQFIDPPTPAGKCNSAYRSYTKPNESCQIRPARKWSLTATVASVAGKTGNNILCVARSAEFMTDSKAITDMEFAPPFSVGVLVHKELNQTFGVETGVMYSFLSTSYRDISYTYEASLKLHYVGIPLLLTVNLWQTHPNWRLYTSGGLTVEKGLQAELTQQLYGADKVINRKTRIDGWQWSLQLSAGISYRLAKDWEVYLEPKLSYYFDNGQPLSIRTEKSLLPGLGSGIRYVF